MSFTMKSLRAKVIELKDRIRPAQVAPTSPIQHRLCRHHTNVCNYHHTASIITTHCCYLYHCNHAFITTVSITNSINSSYPPSLATAAAAASAVVSSTPTSTTMNISATTITKPVVTQTNCIMIDAEFLSL